MELKIGNLSYQCYDFQEEIYVDNSNPEPRKYWVFYLIINSDTIINIEMITNNLNAANNSIIITKDGNEYIKTFKELHFCYFDHINNILTFKINV